MFLLSTESRRCFVVTSILLAFVCVGSAEDQQAPASWPNWLGPNWDGVSNEAGWSPQLPEEGLPVVWSKEIGIGFSSMSITDGKLYAMGHVDGREIVYCLNIADGSEVWRHDYPCKLVDNLHEGGPCATPTIEGEFVYTLGREGQLFCFKKETGEIVWKRMLQDDLEVELPEWGFSASPRIVGERLILEAGRVVSYHKGTGELQWKTEPHLAGYGSVTPFTREGVALIASLDCDGLRIIKEEDGTEVAFAAWRSPFRTNSTTPIIVGDTVFISTGYNIGCGLFRFQEGKLTEVYSHRQMRNHFNNSILHDGYLYGVDGNSNLGRVVQLTCMDYETGEVMWKQRGLGCGSLMIADNKLVILSESGELVIAKTNSVEVEEISRTRLLTGRCWTVPVLFGGHVYARNATGHLVCVKLPALEK